MPMNDLWFIPGFYFLSAQESDSENRYCVTHLSDWLPSWFVLLSNGSADRYFYDVKKLSMGKLPIFYYEPEESPLTGQIYDSIEVMFATVLKCYEESAYFVNEDGRLDADWPRKVEIARKLNPASDYWLRGDLYGSGSL
jgi:hypothetical protein